jgi:hypothetical protein
VLLYVFYELSRNTIELQCDVSASGAASELEARIAVLDREIASAQEARASAAACLARLFVRPSTTAGLVKFWQRLDARVLVDNARVRWDTFVRQEQYGAIYAAPVQEIAFPGSVMTIPILFAAICVGETAWVKEMIGWSRGFEKFEWQLRTGGKRVCALDVAKATGSAVMIRIVRHTRFAGFGSTVHAASS